MPELPGHDRREERRARRKGRRIVRNGDEFTSDELERGVVELEEPDPSGPEPEGGGYEPWDMDDSATGRMSETVNGSSAHREFVESRRREDPDYGDDT